MKNEHFGGIFGSVVFGYQHKANLHYKGANSKVRRMDIVLGNSCDRIYGRDRRCDNGEGSGNRSIDQRSDSYVVRLIDRRFVHSIP